MMPNYKNIIKGISYILIIIWFFIAGKGLFAHMKIVKDAVMQTMNLSDEQIRLVIYGKFYEFIQECKKEIPEDATVFLITNNFFDYYYSTYYLYPRRVLINAPDKSVDGLVTKSISLNLDKEFLEKNNISYLIRYDREKDNFMIKKLKL
ncbi:MAG: hypothetical protein A2551_02970 [Elusimicrobia bacterium RIFOXYD2_FULL_34_30]|nr:MAG: hypothetical protein A2551_02970 [Elusimicrobia bacterium RIFOXYD2_FULL_34_30]